MWPFRIRILIGRAEASKLHIQEARVFGSFWYFSQHPTVPCRIPTENVVVEKYFSTKLFHYKSIGPTSLTMANRSHKLDYYGQSHEHSVADLVLKRGGTPILFALLGLTGKN